MAEQLTIRNFAGLNISIEIGRINIFIGPQASGKSVCIKCIAYFQAFTGFLTNHALDGSTKQEVDNSFIDYFSTLFAQAETIGEFNLRYSINDNFIELRSSKSKISLLYSERYSELYSRMKRVYAQQNNPSSLIPEASYNVIRPLLEEAELSFGPFITGNHLFVPTNRAHFSLLRRTGGAPLSIISDDPMASWFQGFYHFLKKQQLRKRYKEFPHRNGNKSIVGLINQILRATLVKEDKEDIVVHHNGARTSLRQASSGQQESLPLLLVLEYLAGSSSRDLASVLFVEEPETHLHPEAQRDIVNLLAVVYNISSKPLQFFITTHSPYLLACFNNLLYAKQVASTLKTRDAINRKKLLAIVPKEQQLAIGDFRAYKLENGNAISIISAEDNLLEAGMLDGVSETISREFDALLQVEYGR